MQYITPLGDVLFYTRTGKVIFGKYLYFLKGSTEMDIGIRREISRLEMCLDAKT